MKTKLLFALPFLLLTSCGAAAQKEAEQEFKPFMVVEKGIPTIHYTPKGDHVTYLMISQWGRVDGQAGTNISDPDAHLYLNNAIAYVGEPGAALPDATRVTTTVDGASFRGWAQYNDNIYPDYLTTVPQTSGQIVYAIFDGTKTSGQGSGGGGGGGQITSGFGIKVGNTPYQGTHTGTNMDGKEEYKVTGVTVNQGDKFCLYDFGTGGTWSVDLNPWSFGGTQEAPTWSQYVTKNSADYTALQTFTADFYIQIKMGEDSLYIELK